MKTKILIFFLLFVFNLRIISQIPGYMGKRFTVGYSTSLCPNFISGDFGLNYHRSFLTHSLNLAYVYSVKREITLSVRYNSRKIFYYTYIPNSYGITETIEKFSSIEYSLGLKKFNRAKLAPLGAYSKWEAIFIASHVNYKPYETENQNYSFGEPLTISNPGGTIKFKSIGGAYTRGWQRIFGDKYVVDYGAKGMMMLLVLNDGAGNNYTKGLVREIDHDLSLAPVFNIFIGIGFLAF